MLPELVVHDSVLVRAEVSDLQDLFDLTNAGVIEPNTLSDLIAATAASRISPATTDPGDFRSGCGGCRAEIGHSQADFFFQIGRAHV